MELNPSKKEESLSNKDNNKCVCAKKTSIGGQALIEGIMMRGPKKTAMAVRTPEGSISLEEWENEPFKYPKITKIPILRGVVNFIFTMKMGYKCLMRSAEIAMPEDEIQPEKKPKKEKKRKAKEEPVANTTVAVDGGEQSAAEAMTDAVAEGKPAGKKDDKKDSVLMTVIMMISTVLGVAISIGLFIMLPTFIYGWLTDLFPALISKNAALNSLIKSVFEGFLKIAVLVGYMLLVSLMKDIRRTFMYHGAEHKTIFCYENGLELTVENVRAQRRFHPRCGTSFLILMLIVGIFISFFIDPLFMLTIGSVPHVAIRAVIKLLLLPLMMGAGYELIKLAGRYDNVFTRIISAPGMWLQHITVLEPEDSMIECAIEAFVKVIPEDNSDSIK